MQRLVDVETAGAVISYRTSFFSPSLFVPSCAADILLTFGQEIHGESVVKRFTARAVQSAKKIQ